MKHESVIGNGSNTRPLSLGLALLGVLARLIPHVPNITPVGGLSLFAGARLRGWQAYLVPMGTILATDPILGAMLGFRAYTGVTPFVCASFMISVWVGRYLRCTENPWRIGGAALVCSLQFFFITNFAIWLLLETYPDNWAGLVGCYVAAIPYLGRTLLGDLIYSSLLFGLHAWLSRRSFPGERVSSAEPAVSR